MDSPPAFSLHVVGDQYLLVFVRDGLDLPARAFGPTPRRALSSLTVERAIDAR